MTDAAISAALCLLVACPPVFAEAPTRGCVVLNPAQQISVSAKDLRSKDLCTRAGERISLIQVGNTRDWAGKIVPPYNRVTLTPKGDGGPTTVSIQTPTATYKAKVEP